MAMVMYSVHECTINVVTAFAIRAALPLLLPSSLSFVIFFYTSECFKYALIESVMRFFIRQLNNRYPIFTMKMYLPLKVHFRKNEKARYAFKKGILKILGYGEKRTQQLYPELAPIRITHIGIPCINHDRNNVQLYSLWD